MKPVCGGGAGNEPVETGGAATEGGADEADAISVGLFTGWFAGALVRRIIRVRAWPSRSKSMVMPIFRRNVAARRRRPARARGVSGQDFDFETRSPAITLRTGRSAVAVPVHPARVAIRVRMLEATASASMTSSTASSRLPQYDDQNVPAGQNFVSQAVAHAELRISDI